MTETIEIPIWLILILAIAAITAIYRHIISPLAKSYLAAREKNLNRQLRTELARKLPDVLRIGRSARMELFINSAEVQTAIDQAVEENQGPREILEFKVMEYAKELTPGFYSLFYFKIGYSLARAYIRLLYDIQIAKQPPAEIAETEENASVVLVGNHRSNVDVMMLAYLASRTNMVSFAAGEWGRAWPMSTLLHLSGSYIIRRSESLPLYRKILAIHLRNLVKAKMPQGIFLEGGLTRDGSMQSVKLGLLNYLLSALDEKNVHDLVFIPVAFNYAQVPEDKDLLKRQEQGFEDRSKLMTLLSTLWSLLTVVYNRIRRGKTAYGKAAVSFGAPISMNRWLVGQQIARPMSSEIKNNIVARVANEIMARISEMIPVLPVSIVASVLRNSHQDLFTDEYIHRQAAEMVKKLASMQAVLALDETAIEAEIQSGLQTLQIRRVISKSPDGYRINENSAPMLGYLDNTIKHLLEA